MIEAAIDIGTNTILLLIADVSPADSSNYATKFQINKVVFEAMEYARLGEGVHQNRFFLPAAMDRAYKILKKFKDICDQHQVKRIIAVATSASRDARNALEFYQKILNDLQISVQIISGEAEAECSFFGGLLNLKDASDYAIMDIGGGSTEFVIWDQEQLKVLGQSIDVGCVRSFELFLKNENSYSKEVLSRLEQEMYLKWSSIDKGLQLQLKNKKWIAIAGTPTTLAALELNMSEFNSEKINGCILTQKIIEKWYSSLAHLSYEDRKKYSVIGAGRADLIVPGCAILSTAMKFFSQDQVAVSTKGLRYGVLANFTR